MRSYILIYLQKYLSVKPLKHKIHLNKKLQQQHFNQLHLLHTFVKCRKVNVNDKMHSKVNLIQKNSISLNIIDLWKQVNSKLLVPIVSVT